MPYSRVVEIGRVVIVNYGKLINQLAVIIDVVDQSRCLAELVSTKGQSRQVLLFKRLNLTEFTIDIPRNAGKAVVQKAFEKAKVAEKFAASSWGQKLAKSKARANMTDLDRFEVMLAKKKRAALIRPALKKARKAAAK